jgi:hypothetical protein
MENNYSCDADVYCYQPRRGDDFMIAYYAANSGIPGPLSRPQYRATQAPRTTYNSMRDLFLQTHYLAYADDAFKPMVGPPVLPGPDVAENNMYNLPLDYFTEPQVRREKCSCGGPKPTDRVFGPKT